MILMLLKHGADPLRADGEGWCPIHYAARFGDCDIIESLINAQKVAAPGSECWPTSDASTKTEGGALSSEYSSASDGDDESEICTRCPATIPTREERWTPLHIATRFEQAGPRAPLSESAARRSGVCGGPGRPTPGSSGLVDGEALDAVPAQLSESVSLRRDSDDDDDPRAPFRPIPRPLHSALPFAFRRQAS